MDAHTLTAGAARIVGLSYGGFRTFLARHRKEGWRAVGHREASSGRWAWSKFGIPELCALRVTKLLQDTGATFGMASGVATDSRLFSYFTAEDVDAQGDVFIAVCGSNFTIGTFKQACEVARTEDQPLVLICARRVLNRVLNKLANVEQEIARG